VSYDSGGVVRYLWGDKTLAFISCKVCGCTMHWESLDPDNHSRMAVNCNLAKSEDTIGLRVRNFDGANSRAYVD